MIIQENISLKNYNTFGIDQKTAFFASLNAIDDLISIEDVVSQKKLELLVLGGGSNLLFTKNFNGLCLKNNLQGIELLSETEDFVIVKAMAGEVWHEFVLWNIKRGYAGLENLSLIPGCVGAAPMQNIGAYGVEIKDSFFELEAFHRKTGEVHTFSLSDCEFGYRESVFKRKVKNEYIILSVSFKLNKKPNFNTAYGAIQQELTAMNVSELSIQAISNAVINIRSSKLPNPKEIGNAGSFFKNPVVATELATDLKNKFPEAPVYNVDEDNSKLAAGWLIEQCGWKGKTIDERYGVHKNQALVLVNYSNATGSEIWNLSQDIINSVEAKFGVLLEREVNIL